MYLRCLFMAGTPARRGRSAWAHSCTASRGLEGEKNAEIEELEAIVMEGQDDTGLVHEEFVERLRTVFHAASHAHYALRVARGWPAP